jgi:alanine racemase
MNELEKSLLVAKTITLLNAGFTSEQCMSVKEYEFSVIGGKLVNMEIWSNTKRTKGYRVIETPKSIENIFADFVA